MAPNTDFEKQGLEPVLALLSQGCSLVQPTPLCSHLGSGRDFAKTNDGAVCLFVYLSGDQRLFKIAYPIGRLCALEIFEKWVLGISRGAYSGNRVRRRLQGIGEKKYGGCEEKG